MDAAHTGRWSDRVCLTEPKWMNIFPWNQNSISKSKNNILCLRACLWLPYTRRQLFHAAVVDPANSYTLKVTSVTWYNTDTGEACESF